MLHPLLGGNLGPWVQRHLPLRKRGQMQPGGWILQLHCRLARQPLRATVPGKHTHTRLAEIKTSMMDGEK